MKSLKGHVRKKGDTMRSKVVCLECQCLSHNCKPRCSGQHIYSLYKSFRPPKRGSKKWKYLEKFISQNAITTTSGNKYSPVFGSHGAGMYKRTWAKSIFESAYINTVQEEIFNRNNESALSKKEKIVFKN